MCSFSWMELAENKRIYGRWYLNLDCDNFSGRLKLKTFFFMDFTISPRIKNLFNFFLIVDLSLRS